MRPRLAATCAGTLFLTTLVPCGQDSELFPVPPSGSGLLPSVTAPATAFLKPTYLSPVRSPVWRCHLSPRQPSSFPPPAPSAPCPLPCAHSQKADRLVRGSCCAPGTRRPGLPCHLLQACGPGCTPSLHALPTGWPLRSSPASRPCMVGLWQPPRT